MTYSIAAKCSLTGMFGVAVTTSSICVGARCAYARAGVGAVLTQHRTDPRLGPKGLDLLAQGLPAKDVIERLTGDVPGIGWRQLAVVDRDGRTAAYHGERITSVHSADEGPGCIAIGNIIRTKAVTRAMVDAFGADPQLHLAERLVRGMEAGYAAGGEPKQVKSAALLVVESESFPLVDLRVDYNPQPLGQLRWLWEIYEPSMKLYVDRAVDPDSVPGPA
ncbi:MAG: DUF1028 domain-containing protein [Alphaproteobacteria bacterium]|nr:DUF1028 domain-containing protein [Alphaproteobacteria bacterium]